MNSTAAIKYELIPDGTSVRLTMGQNVIVGTVLLDGGAALRVRPEGMPESHRGHVFDRTLWHVASLKPGWAERVGAVVLDGDGDAWQRRSALWHVAGLTGQGALTYENLLREYGPVTLVHDPEAVS